MKRIVLTLLLGLLLGPTHASAQQRVIAGRVTDEAGGPLSGVAVSVRGTNTGTMSNAEGRYTIVAAEGQVLQFRLIGTTLEERTVGSASVINVQLRANAVSLDGLVVTALGQTATQRSLGTAQQTIRGADVAQSQRDNFVNALQGRIAGVEVTSTSGVPGASSQITIRGVSSISGNNQPLMIIDGLPIDNKTLNTNVFATQAGSFENRGVDFTNRAADVSPEDIESITVLKGPEASALYGIDAANGAIVITTKRGRPGVGGLEYSNSIRMESVRTQPEIQRVYGQSTVGSVSLLYWGAPYEAGTQFFNNVDGFFQTAVTQRHNLSFSGATADNGISYRLATSLTNQQGVIPNTGYDRINVTGASKAQVNPWLNVDLSMNYAYAENDQVFKGAGSPLIGLLVWPQTDDASDFLTPAGSRRRIATTLAAGSEIDNPYFNAARNGVNSRNNRLITNFGVVLTPFAWGNLRTNLGADTYTNQNQILRHPESAYGFSQNGLLDIANDMVRNLSAQTVLNVNRRTIGGGLAISGLVGHAVTDARSHVDAMQGRDFLEPNFVSANNANLRFNRSTIAQRRLVSGFGQATFDYNQYLFVTVTGRNDWTSTIPQGANSFFYPSVSSSFVFSDVFPAVGEFMTGKLRAAYAQVGKDARPYAYLPALEYKSTSYGGYGFGFWGPNRDLKPEFAHSYEFGTELGFLDNRLGVDATVYRKQTENQIVENIRGSYGTGFILFNLNGAETRNQGVELTVRGTPVLRRGFSWDVLVNFDRTRGTVLSLPNELPESYNSDTWLYGNVRNGTRPGASTRALTGAFYLRNDNGDLLIDPTSGLPLRSTAFIDAGYDRQPDFTIGVTNTLRMGRGSLSFLWDIRKGGDVMNATEHFLTARGLTMRTLDRNEPRVVKGVLRDGRENSTNPTPNNIVIIPAIQTGYYTTMSEELFIEKDVNWVRLRDVTARFGLPARFGRNASIFVTGTDLLLFTNYSGLDPIVNATSAAVGGSGAAGIDYGNFPIPRGLNFGIRTSF